MRQKLTKFLNSPTRNTWLYSKQMEVYVRKGFHCGADKQGHRYLDIASITVIPEARHQGHFKAFLALCQEIQPYDGIKIENVLNEDLRAYLRALALLDHRWSEQGIEECPDFLWENFGAGGRG